MSDCGAEPVKSMGRARARRMVRVCGPATIPALGPCEPVPGNSESVKPVGRARGRRTVRVCGPATISARETVLGFSESSSKEKLKLFILTPLRQVRRYIYIYIYIYIVPFILNLGDG
jgi:hypothetical protein